MPIKKFLGGISRFQKQVFPKHQDLFKKLALRQRPKALFLTCADSRIDPCLLTQTKPGELFVCRVIGNVVPPYPNMVGGVSATVEYAVGVLRVPDLIVCGHTDCGVMKGALSRDALEGYPNVLAWLRYVPINRSGQPSGQRSGEPSGERSGDRSAGPSAERSAERSKAALSPESLLACTERNVLAQLKNLRSHPAVAARLSAGGLALHGWVYHIGSGVVTAYDKKRRQFLPLGSPRSTAASKKSRPSTGAACRH